MRAKWVLTLIVLAFACHVVLFIVRAIRVADTKVHFCAANSVTLAFIIAFAAAWTHFIKVLIDLAHVWMRVRLVVLFLFFFFFLLILFVFAPRLTMAPTPVGTISHAFTLVISRALLRPERVQFFIVTTFGFNVAHVLGVAFFDIHFLDVGVHS